MIGFVFACSGMVVFLGMVAITEASRMLRSVLAAASACCLEHDTDVFPDEFNHPFPNFITPP